MLLIDVMCYQLKFVLLVQSMLMCACALVGPFCYALALLELFVVHLLVLELCCVEESIDDVFYFM